MDSDQKRVALPDGLDVLALVGAGDRNLRTVEELCDVTVGTDAGSLLVSGASSDVALVTSLLSELIDAVQDGNEISPDQIRRSVDVLRTSDLKPSSLRKDTVLTYRGRAIRPKTVGQKHYCDAIRANTVTFGIGPAGTGKTYLAMAMAIAALDRREISRVILTRPVVEAGENLGFLPGTLTEKVDPYVRPLYDALFDMTDRDRGMQLLEQGVIEIAPLAFIRGRTFNDAFLILDEAQNTTPEQMKMFLTRLGFGSKMVVTGDITQTDLPTRVSGLIDARNVLEGIEGVSFCDFTGADVVRHSLVARIVRAYDDARIAKQAQLDLREATGDDEGAR